jgi:hypothetical protein
MQELAHVFEPILSIEIIFIGPDLKKLLNWTEIYRESPMETCPSCTHDNRTRTYSFYRDTYESYRSSIFYKPATLAVAFNCGFHEIPEWIPALKLMFRDGVPVCYTSYNQSEAVGDARVVRELGGRIMDGYPCVNPYGSMVPIVDAAPDLPVNSFYYRNHYLTLVDGNILF